MKKKEKEAWIQAIDETIKEYKERTHAIQTHSCKLCILTAKSDPHNEDSDPCGHIINCYYCIQPKVFDSNREYHVHFHCMSHRNTPQHADVREKRHINTRKVEARILFLEALKQRLIDSPPRMTFRVFKMANEDIAMKDFRPEISIK